MMVRDPGQVRKKIIQIRVRKDYFYPLRRLTIGLPWARESRLLRIY